jgi:hypothetical protein
VWSEGDDQSQPDAIAAGVNRLHAEGVARRADAS